MFVLGHVAHYLWVLYLPPMLVVVGAIVRSTLQERRERRAAPPPTGEDAPLEDLGETPLER